MGDALVQKKAPTGAMKRIQTILKKVKAGPSLQSNRVYLQLSAESVLLQTILSSRAAKRGGGSNEGGFPDPDLSFSLFVPICPFWDFPDFSGIFPICSGMVRGFSRFVLFLFLGLSRAPTRNSPERVRDTIWTFPEKSGKPPGLETPRFLSIKRVKAGPKLQSSRVYLQLSAESVLLFLGVRIRKLP